VCEYLERLFFEEGALRNAEDALIADGFKDTEGSCSQFQTQTFIQRQVVPLFSLIDIK
jgi:hypothetical protein